MSSPSNTQKLRKQFEDLIASGTQKRVTLDLKTLEKETSYLVEDLNTQYSLFFGLLLKDIQGLQDTASGRSPMPARLKPYSDPKWRPLDKEWIAQKQKTAYRANGSSAKSYYQGITQYLAASRNPKKRLGPITKDGRRGVGRAPGRTKSLSNVPAFTDFLGAHQADLAYVQRIFGKIETAYELKSSGKTLKTKAVDGIITSVKSPSKGTMPKSYQVKVSISAFGAVLGGKTLNEWSVVDLLLKQRDPANEGQWVKINGQRGHMRPLILPMIRWFMADRFREEIKNFFGEIK